MISARTRRSTSRNPFAAGPRAAGRELTQARADVVMELVGTPAVVAEGIDMLCNGGTYVEIGNINQRLTASSTRVDCAWRKTILGLMWYPPDCLRQALQLLSTRRIGIRSASCSRISSPLGDRRGFREQDSGAVHRAALLPWDDMARCEQAICARSAATRSRRLRQRLYLRYIIGRSTREPFYRLRNGTSGVTRCRRNSSWLTSSSRSSSMARSRKKTLNRRMSADGRRWLHADARLQEVKQLGISVSEYPLRRSWNENVASRNC